TNLRGDRLRGCRGALMRALREGILRFARDAIFPRDQFGGFAHAHSRHWIREPQLEADAWTKITHAKTRHGGDALERGFRSRKFRKFSRSLLRVEQRHIAHAFSSADDEN